MRRLTIVSSALLASACATAPQAPVAQPPRPHPVERGGLIGLTAAELVQRFGTPALQIREGAGLKLQFRSARCVLDAYLYPPVGGRPTEQVTHVDARRPDGTDFDQAGCIATLQRG